MELVAVAAVAENGVIGRDGGLPWDTIPADRRQYRARVADHPVILGRRTFESMRDDPPGSARIVLTRSPPDVSLDAVRYVTGVDDAVATVDALGADRAYVLGGAAIYDLFQPHVTRMVLSRIPGSYEGNAFYPDWDRDEWTLRGDLDFEAFTLEHWVRRASGDSSR